jgi:hypothetical protein
MGKNNKDTKRTRHIARRMHYVRDGIASGAFQTYKIDGKLNTADIGTKNQPSERMRQFKPYMHVNVDP